jgi:xenotropic and polytropic retrovirus receptor 1
VAALEHNGVSFVGSKAKKKQLLAGGGGRGVLDIPPTSPGRAAFKVWEELVNVFRKDGADPADVFVHCKKVCRPVTTFLHCKMVQHAGKNIRDMFLVLY